MGAIIPHEDTENRGLKNVSEIQDTEETEPVQRILTSQDNETNNIKGDPVTQETENSISSQRKSESKTGNDNETDKMKSDPVVQEPEEMIPLQRTSKSRTDNQNDNETHNMKGDPVVQESHMIPLPRTSESRTDNDNITSTKKLKKKEITWTHSSYLDKVSLQNLDSRSLAWMLDRKASVGPCFRNSLPHGQPSGITICLPKKSQKCFLDNIKPNKAGGICITVSKKCLNNTLKISSDYELGKGIDRIVFPRKSNRLGIKIEDDNCVHILENLKGKLENWRGKIKHALHM